MAEPRTPLNPAVANAMNALTTSIIQDNLHAANALSKTTPKTTPASGKKRKASETTLEEQIEAYKADLNEVHPTSYFEDDPLPSCASIRTKLNKLFDSGIMTKAEFSRATGANSNSLNNFLKAKGPYGGSGSTVWRNAYDWFKQREVAGLKMPDPKKSQAKKQKNADGTSSSGKTTGPDLPDINDIHLPGEEIDEVPIYDDCDEIRRKINAHMKTPGLSQAQFCRNMYASFKVPKGKGIQSKQLSDFRGAKGANAGATSAVYYGAYVYFEKLRIAQGKPRTQHSELMMDLNPGGMPRDVDDRTTWFIGAA
ncbi:hypothetical protein NW752_001302 [Fusarium irregulare]|uniref:DUF7726 domain-containing protein n=1 Tax=Fusarium irregulare TaxID=2494466 RepID=A0A9W8U6K7_9HYPO|nr:hypothetical protein NW766_010882 [Fusarium irregulare]KAJ4026362.1 hypothetical protein NW752_001302 [Fusarium irregulare]